MKKLALISLTVCSLVFCLPAVQAATKIELVPSSRVILEISPDMTLDDIIRRVYPTEQALWPMLREKLIETNPYSFLPNSDKLINGARLKLVDIKRIYEKDLKPLTQVGYVARLQGLASSRDINDQAQRLQINSLVYEGDRISTEIGANLLIYLDDGAEVHLKEDSVIKISEYVITGGFDQDSSSILDLLRGGFRKITGSIGQSALANYQVQTGLATIGIRGTEYVIKLCKIDDCTQTVSRNDPDAKLHAVVLEGSITLTTDEEVQILMALGEYGTATPEVLQIEEQAPVPTGFLDKQESHKFNVTIPKQLEEAAKDESSGAWKWILGILLLAAAL